MDTHKELILITGATSGIGKAAAQAIAAQLRTVSAPWSQTQSSLFSSIRQ
jgi:NAD(P)-dependent dehydrogenase (short-subunit alcohol dehydrogenase family)